MALQFKIGADFGDAIKESKVLEGTLDGLIGKLSGLNKNINISINPELDAERLRQQISLIKDSVTEISSKIDVDSSEFQSAFKSIQSKLSSLDDLSVDITANKSQVEAAINDVKNDLLRLRDVASVSIILNEGDVKQKIAALNNLLSNVKANVDTSQFESQINTIQGKINSLDRIDITANTTQAEAAVNEILSDLGKLKTLNVIPVGLDDGNTLSRIQGIKTVLSGLTANINTSEFDSDIRSIQNKISSLETIDLTVNDSGVESKLNEILSDISRLQGVGAIPLTLQDIDVTSKINQLKGIISTLKANIDTTQFEGAIKLIEGKISSLDDLSVNVTANTTQIESAIGEVLGDLSRLRDTSIVIKSNGDQVSSVIDSLKAKLTELQTRAASGLTLDTSGLKTAIREIEQEFTGLVSSAKISGDTSALDATIQSIKLKIDSLDTSVDLTGNTSLLESKIAEIQNDLNGLSSNITIQVSEGNLKSQIAGIKSELATLSTSAKVGIDTTEFDAALKDVQSKITALDAPDIDLTANKDQVEATLKEIQGDLKRLKGSVITLSANGKPAIKSINELERELDQLEKELKAATNPKDFQNLARAAALTREQIRGINTSSLSNSLRNVSRQGNEASQTLINLSRVAQDAPFGFIGIANNLNPLVESFQRLQVASKQTGTSLLSNLGSALSGAGGVGLGIGVVSSLLISFGDNLFKSAKSATGLSIALGGLSVDLERIKGNIDSLETGFKFLQSLEELDIDIRLGGTGSLEGGLKKLQTEFVINLDRVNELQKETDEAFKKLTQFDAVAFKSLSRAALNSAENAGTTVSNLPGIILDKLSDSDQKLIAEIKKNTETYQGLEKKRVEAIQNITLLRKRIELQGIEIQKEAAEKQKQILEKQRTDFEKLQNDIISRAKLFAKEFGATFVVPDLEESFFKTKEQIFNSASKLLKDVSTANLKIRLPFQVITEADFIQTEGTPVSDSEMELLRKGYLDQLAKEFQEPFKVDLSLDPNIAKNIDETIKAFAAFGEKGLATFVKASLGARNFGAELEKLRAEQFFQLSLANAIGDAFQSTFQTIRAGGDVLKSFFDGLGNALQQLISRLAATAAAAGILTLISGGTFAGAKGFGAIFSQLLGFPKGAQGGIVPPGFKSDTYPALLSSGEMIFNDKQIRALLDQNGAGGPQIVLISSRLRGRDQVLQLNRENRSQRSR